jgi:hypothetical protein
MNNPGYKSWSGRKCSWHDIMYGWWCVYEVRAEIYRTKYSYGFVNYRILILQKWLQMSVQTKRAITGGSRYLSLGVYKSLAPSRRRE